MTKIRATTGVPAEWSWTFGNPRDGLYAPLRFGGNRHTFKCHSLWKESWSCSRTTAETEAIYLDIHKVCTYITIWYHIDSHINFGTLGKKVGEDFALRFHGTNRTHENPAKNDHSTVLTSQNWAVFQDSLGKKWTSSESPDFAASPVRFGALVCNSGDPRWTVGHASLSGIWDLFGTPLSWLKHICLSQKWSPSGLTRGSQAQTEASPKLPKKNMVYHNFHHWIGHKLEVNPSLGQAQLSYWWLYYTCIYIYIYIYIIQLIYIYIYSYIYIYIFHIISLSYPTTPPSFLDL